jgi:hypothetical protein
MSKPGGPGDECGTRGRNRHLVRTMKPQCNLRLLHRAYRSSSNRQCRGSRLSLPPSSPTTIWIHPVTKSHSTELQESSNRASSNPSPIKPRFTNQHSPLYRRSKGSASKQVPVCGAGTCGRMRKGLGAN